MHENLCGKMQLAVLHLKGDGNSPLNQHRSPKLTDDRRAREGSQDHVRDLIQNQWQVRDPL